MNKKLIIDKWVYSYPEVKPDEEGNIVLISKYSFGPLEGYEWGITPDKQPYEQYKWIENDLYENTNYCKDITVQELVSQIESQKELLEENDNPEWVKAFDSILEWVKLELPGN